MYRVPLFPYLAMLIAGLLSSCAETSNAPAEALPSDAWSVVSLDTSSASSDVQDAIGADTQTLDAWAVDIADGPDGFVTVPVDTLEPDVDADVDAITQLPDGQQSDAADSGVQNVDPWTGPGEVGPFAVNMHGVTVSGEGDSFNGELYVPESPDAVHAILLLPGFMLGATDFSSTSERLASHGFIVLCPSFGDSFLSAIDHADLASHASAMLDWLEAQSELASSPLSGRLDGSAFGMSGHSRGGKVALLTAIQDPRIQAIYTLDPVDTVGGPFSNTPTPENPSVTPELMGDLTIPAGFFGAGKGGDGFQPCAPEAENHEVYYGAANSAPIAYHHVDSGAGHMDFIDSGAPGLCAGGESSAETLKAVQKTLVAFMRAHLSGEADCEPFLDGDSVDPRLTWQSKGP
jgi:pimeloyl-ACP methyl ester carboxylesterase